MALPDIWHYTAQGQYLMGQGKADPSPLEPGKWLIPAHATDIQPGSERSGYIQYFKDGEWFYAELKPIEEPKPIEEVPEERKTARPVEENK